MKLIIAEKPKLALKIVSSIGSSKFKSYDGYYESSEYIVTFSFGHLFGLLDIEEYDSKRDPEEKVVWTMENLPFRPQTFRFGYAKDPKTKKVDNGRARQFKVIKKLCDRSDVDGIIHAGDADREGEVIIRLILEQSKNTKPVYRMWLPNQTPETIRSELHHLRNDGDFDAFAKEGYARTYVDWLYGINLTRLATLKSGSLLRVGRVIVPIVKAIYDRDMEIRHFKPVPYYIVASEEETNGEKIRLVCKKPYPIDQHDAAQAFADTLNTQQAIVTDLKKEEKVISAGKLLNQSGLQSIAGKKYRLSPIETLNIAQKLYDEGYTTYPRTPSEYLATSESKEINRIIGILQDKGYKVEPKDNKRSIYDDSKVESHSAITPTYKMPEPGALSDKEQKVYDIILSRFLAVFCSVPCKVERTTLVITVGDEQFKLRGDVFLQRGWMEYDETNRSDRVLPKLKVGDEVNIAFKLEKKETKPPAHYTVKTLGLFLQNPFKKAKASDLTLEDEPSDDEEDITTDVLLSEDEVPSDDEDYQAFLSGLEIGTEATRADIIDKAIKSEYISLKNNVYRILPRGEYLIESLHQLQIDMGKEKTAEMGRNLKRVYNGELSVDDAVTLAFREVRLCFTAAADIELDAMENRGGEEQKTFGQCPKCGGDIIERDKLFGCSNKDCKFAIWKDSKIFKSIGVKPSGSIVKGLLKDGKVLLKNCKSAKSGNTFACFLHANFIGEYPQYRIEYPDAEDLTLGSCPKCGKPVVERDRLFGCSNEDCRFAIWKDNKLMNSIGAKLNASVVKALLKDGKVLLKNCTSAKSGNYFSCILHANFKGEYPELHIEYADAEDLSLGKCPKCGKPVIERERLFGCSNKDCKFMIMKDDKFFSSIGRKPNSAIVKSLLNKGRVNLKDCVSQKSGKSFNCCVTVDFHGQWPKYTMHFLNNDTKRS